MGRSTGSITGNITAGASMTRLTVAVITVALLLCPGQWARAQGAKNGGPHGGGKAASHMSSKGLENNNAQWSADPERGWVRAEERHDLQPTKGSKEKQKHERVKGKAVNGKGIVEDY